MAKTSSTLPTPLSPAVLHILLALAEGDLHGLGIADHAETASGGAVRLGPGTLYRSLDEMRGSALVQRVDAPSEDSDPRRKYYRITAKGRQALATEVARLERLVEYAKDRAVPEGA
jgi:DNA-binding PadR family transcriptional regulator